MTLFHSQNATSYDKDKIQGIRNDITSHVGPGVYTFSFDRDKLSIDNCLVKFTPASEEEIQNIVKILLINLVN